MSNQARETIKGLRAEMIEGFAKAKAETQAIVKQMQDDTQRDRQAMMQFIDELKGAMPKASAPIQNPQPQPQPQPAMAQPPPAQTQNAAQLKAAKANGVVYTALDVVEIIQALGPYMPGGPAALEAINEEVIFDCMIKQIEKGVQIQANR